MAPIRSRVFTTLRRVVRATRPVDSRTRAALDRRWSELPEGVKTPAQALGRHAVGCEGTHGVFPKCNLTCTPCYHSVDANKVRVDGEHTLREVESQMAFLAAERGPRAHAQLIGGEVSLLSPEDHAAALKIMRDHGREPMSFTHGDFDYDYLRNVVVDAAGRRRFRRVSFAAHFDSLMRGRRGIPRPRRESDLSDYRRRFTEMFARLREEHGVAAYLAHNMTVTPENLDEVSDVVRDVVGMDYSMLSFQPAAFVGDSRRWHDGYRDVDIDAVWQQIERGLGQRVAYGAIQFGEPRCNRTALGFTFGDHWYPFVDADVDAEVRARDDFYAHLGGVNFGGTHPALLAIRVGRVLLAYPRGYVVAARWAGSLVRRCGGVRLLFAALIRREVHPMTFVVHRFMDAADVAPAWAMMQAGTPADDPAIRATQERLAACTYTMAHPETGKLVPACAQHSVLDPDENASLRKLLPLSVATGHDVGVRAQSRQAR
ncbi:radical SAM domain-containing protein [Rhodococcus marinonascens]|uniref:radical SAM domain-containing protein n=1 Tax=Rhodococcus marinonascens TaxID=38311 RepID=UPI00093309FB|nr:radical SAM domain-containing protein [Rhodococcus marinonascens]